MKSKNHIDNLISSFSKNFDKKLVDLIPLIIFFFDYFNTLIMEVFFKFFIDNISGIFGINLKHNKFFHFKHPIVLVLGEMLPHNVVFA